MAFLNSRLPSLVCQLNHGLLDILFVVVFCLFEAVCCNVT